MFQRIARRHADRSDEPVPSETAAMAVPAEPGANGHAPGEVPAAEAAQAGGQPAAEAPETDAPTQRIEAVAPAPSVEQPTVFQPVAPAPAEAPAPVAAEPTAPVDAQARRPGFRARGRMRRRLRYLRRLRELQVRDLGGLVFDLRRFERKRDDLVVQKIDRIRACDDELRALELALGERRDLRDVREPGIGGTCPRCFAVHGSADRFCANCGAALGGAVQGPAIVPPAPSTAPPEASGAGPER